LFPEAVDVAQPEDATPTFGVPVEFAAKLFEVARTALGIPLAAARADIDVLARTIEKKLNIADLKDPAKLDNFVKRFAAMYDIENGGGVQSSNNIALGLLTGSIAADGFSQDTLASLQSMRFRQF